MSITQSHTKLSLEDAECLVGWPVGSVGHQNELVAISKLLQLCDSCGYGRIPQLARQIESLWRDPSKIQEIRQERDTEMEMMQRLRANIEDKEASDWFVKKYPGLLGEECENECKGDDG